MIALGGGKTLTLNQSFSPEYPELLGKLSITYTSSVEGQSVYISLEFDDKTNPSIILDDLKNSVRKETEAVYRKIQIKEEIKNCKEELSLEQKCVLVLYLCKFTENTQENKAMFSTVFHVENTMHSSVELMLLTTKDSTFLYHIVCSIRNKKAIDTFISFCCSFSSFLLNQQIQKEFNTILSEWGYSKSEIKLFINDAIHRIVVPDNYLDVLERPFPLSIAEQQKILWAYLKDKLYAGYSSERSTLTYSQKCSLFATVVSLCHPHHVPNDREDITEIVANYAVHLNLNQQDVEKSFVFQTTTDRDKNLEIVKSIKDDTSLMCFISVCKNIIDIAEDFASMTSFFHELLFKLGYMIDECILLDRGGHVYKHQQNSDSEEDDSENADDFFMHHWTLEDFMIGRDNGVEIKYVTNKETGEEFKVCVLVHDDGFSVSLVMPTYLEEMSSAEILERKASLKVGITAYGNFCLYDEDLTFHEFHYLGI